MKKKLLLLVPIILVLALGIWIVSAKKTASPKIETSSPSPAPVAISSDDAFKNALNLYIQKKSEGVDMTNGPCLGKVADGWVLDIAHNPREPIDDEPQNQCDDYKTDKAQHYIELDPSGNLITAN